MNILLILAHPNPGSFNHAIAQTVRAALAETGHSVASHDLYAEGFDPIIPAAELERDAPLPPWLEKHCRELAAADGIVIVHPNWWGQPPAVLKGWIDRVIRPGVAYRFLDGDGGEGIPVGLLRARRAVVFNTSNTPMERERATFGDPLDTLWRRCIFDFCGVKDVRRRTFGVVVTSTPAQREEWLAEARRMVLGAFEKQE